MSKLKNVWVAVVSLSVFMVAPAFPQGNAGCKTGKFIGSYTKRENTFRSLGRQDQRRTPGYHPAQPA